jgi:hypothetical protein
MAASFANLKASTLALMLMPDVSSYGEDPYFY